MKFPGSVVIELLRVFFRKFNSDTLYVSVLQMATTVYERKIASVNPQEEWDRGKTWSCLICVFVFIFYWYFALSFHAFSIAFPSINFNFPSDEQKANF